MILVIVVQKMNDYQYIDDYQYFCFKSLSVFLIMNSKNQLLQFSQPVGNLTTQSLSFKKLLPTLFRQIPCPVRFWTSLGGVIRCVAAPLTAVLVSGAQKSLQVSVTVTHLLKESISDLSLKVLQNTLEKKAHDVSFGQLWDTWVRTSLTAYSFIMNHVQYIFLWDVQCLYYKSEWNLFILQDYRMDSDNRFWRGRLLGFGLYSAPKSQRQKLPTSISLLNIMNHVPLMSLTCGHIFLVVTFIHCRNRNSMALRSSVWLYFTDWPHMSFSRTKNEVNIYEI